MTRGREAATDLNGGQAEEQKEYGLDLKIEWEPCLVVNKPGM